MPYPYRLLEVGHAHPRSVGRLVIRLQLGFALGGDLRRVVRDLAFQAFVVPAEGRGHQLRRGPSRADTAVEGLEAHELHCELTAPDGSSWTFGPADAPSSVRGPAGEFCRIGARRLRPQDSSLVTTGPHAAEALRVLRNYAA